jgi:hypothetical protein
LVVSPDTVLCADAPVGGPEWQPGSLELNNDKELRIGVSERFSELEDRFREAPVVFRDRVQFKGDLSYPHPWPWQQALTFLLAAF